MRTVFPKFTGLGCVKYTLGVATPTRLARLFVKSHASVSIENVTSDDARNSASLCSFSFSFYFFTFPSLSLSLSLLLVDDIFLLLLSLTAWRTRTHEADRVCLPAYEPLDVTLLCHWPVLGGGCGLLATATCTHRPRCINVCAPSASVIYRHP